MAPGQGTLTLGADLGGTRLKVGLFRENGTVVKEENVAAQVDRGVDHVLHRMVTVFENIIRVAGNGMPVEGVGLGIAGLIDGWNGIVREAPNLPGWRDIPVKHYLENRLQIPVIMDNDANVAALAEFCFGAGQGVNSMMMVTLGTGVGGGLIFGGEIYRGEGGLAGEFGHTVVDLDGPPCHCGNKGCIESFIGNYAILQRFFHELDQGGSSTLESTPREKISVETISQAGNQGDSLARRVFTDAGRALGVGFANIVNLLNIKRFVVGGGVAKAGKMILDPAREMMRKTAFKASLERVDVVPAKLGDRAGMVGAARLARVDL